MDLINCKTISVYFNRTFVSVWVLKHFEPQKVILRVLLNGEGRYLKVQLVLPLHIENVSLHFIRQVAFEFMNKRHFYYSILNEHGKKVNEGTSDFLNEASEFCEPWKRYNTN
jgi:hypothetical protein